MIKSLKKLNEWYRSKILYMRIKNDYQLFILKIICACQQRNFDFTIYNTILIFLFFISKKNNYISRSVHDMTRRFYRIKQNNI